MAPDRWHVISRIYHDALARAPHARDVFIREACVGEPEVEREVRSLLAQSSSDSFLHAPMSPGSGAVDNVPPTLTGTLGRFELRGLLGAGGMGEVYRAHDVGLGRDVAVKILPAAFTTDPDRLARFEREARVLAALNHPHIAAIYGIEEIGPQPGSEGSPRRALVLELVEGETLAERLRRGPIPMADALEIAGQMADALEAAHEKGIVHRDLKPANIKIRPDGVVKVLDFGLAKAVDPAMGYPQSTVDQHSPSETAAGLIVGTPAYMSPEQARGQGVDKRADIWAFGCVLYEMLVGRAPFTGETIADIVAAVLERGPDWRALPEATPVAVRRLLERCLERNPRRRLRDIGDARLELEDREGAGLVIEPRTNSRNTLMWGATAGLVLASTLSVVWLWPEATPPSVLFTLQAADGQIVADTPVPAPDGRQLVFVASTLSGDSALWTRPLDSSLARRIPGTENAERPFWSPDGQFVGFSADKVLKRTALSGGPVQRITELDPATLGASWSRNNVILFTPSNKAPLHRVSAAGGQHEPLTALNGERRENSHRWPHFLPDGRHFLFTARSDLPEHTGIYVGELGSPGSPKWLLAVQSSAVYVPSGHLLFVRDSTLLAQPFDLDRLELSGEPVAVAGEIRTDTSAARGQFAVSADGTVLTYNTVARPRLVWFDRSGREAGSVEARGDFSQIRLAPDASHAAVVIPDRQSGNRDVWSIDLENGGLTRLTSHPASDWFPVWSPDGSEVIFASDRDKTPTLYRTAANGDGGDTLVLRSDSTEAIFPTDWSPDGRAVVFHSYPRGNISLLSLVDVPTTVPFVESPFTDWTASFSPDGRWMAYVSDESGIDEVYVKPIGRPGKYRVSVGGAIQPRWRGDSRELFFLGAGDRLVSVTIGAAHTFTAGPPTRLFDGCGSVPGQPIRSAFMYRYDVTADGNRSLWICPDSNSVLATVAVHGLSAPTSRRR